MAALRINLLPAYIADERNTKIAIAASAALFLLCVGAPLVYFATVQAATTAKETEANDEETKASTATAAVTKVKGEASALRAEIAPIKDKGDFVTQVYFYNTWVQKIYRRAVRYTDSHVEYSSMAVNNGTLSMTGYVNSVDDLARYLITFYGNPDVTAVSVTGPPGWQRPTQTVNPLPGQNPAAAKGFTFSVNATLLKSLQKPVLPASLSAPIAGATAPAGGGAAARPSANFPRRGGGAATAPTAAGSTGKDDTGGG